MFLTIVITLAVIWLGLGILMALLGGFDNGCTNWWEPIVVVFLGPVLIIVEAKEEILGFLLNLIFFTSPILLCLVLYFLRELFS
ncbi:hypothetical protein ACO0K9_26810 [Undibacterium sp. Ji50W]|uniref:hypothetical protein n=1 Tax=Undibacterium sp. Ji50W TaxID=3413041 RepID=UPI003BF38273